MDDEQSPGQFQQRPAPTQTKTSTKNKPVAVVVLGILVALLLVLTGFTYKNWQDTKSELKSSQSELSSKNTELQKANQQLEVYRDAKRKADLTSFASTVRAYNSKNGHHLTTEGSISKNIYETQLSKSIDNFKDPKTEQLYDYVAVAAVQSPPPLKVGTIQYQWAGKCGTKTLEDTTDQSLSAVATLLEDGTMYCLQI